MAPKVSITPTPTPEQAAAIVAAHEALWPKPSAAPTAPDRSIGWRFSGRWWMRDRFASTDRPWN